VEAGEAAAAAQSVHDGPLPSPNERNQRKKRYNAINALTQRTL
jgi:hypothetical protein